VHYLFFGTPENRVLGAGVVAKVGGWMLLRFCGSTGI
jgi:hypothetical protein